MGPRAIGDVESPVASSEADVNGSGFHRRVAGIHRPFGLRRHDVGKDAARQKSVAHVLRSMHRRTTTTQATRHGRLDGLLLAKAILLQAVWFKVPILPVHRKTHYLLILPDITTSPYPLPVTTHGLYRGSFKWAPLPRKHLHLLHKNSTLLTIT